jgi:NitT/TauT family transport system ATP-binding protein
MSLELKGVSKSFIRTDGQGLTYAIENISFTVCEGEFVSIIGQSGCGKSTILRLVAGLISPTTGSIFLNDKAIKGSSPKRGMVFQKPTLFPWLTVYENANFSLRMTGQLRGREKYVDRLIATAGLQDFVTSYPHQLSGGMAQRLALIRTMANDPEVFLMDEPLGALDAFTRMHMQDELISMWLQRKRIMVMVTHDIDEAIFMSTRILVMAPRPGRIREEIPIDLDYPRNRASKKFLEYRVKAMEMLDFGHIE